MSDNALKLVANGGQVTDAQADDVVLKLASDLSGAAMSYELVYYNGTTGEAEFWVKKATLAVGDVFYAGIGDSGITTSQTAGNAWEAGFIGVYHFGTPSSLSANDSTTNANNLSGVNTPTAATGIIGGAASLASASSQYFTLPNIASVFDTDAASMSIWVKLVDHTPASSSSCGLLGLNAGASIDYYPFTDGNIYSATFKLARTTVGSGLIADRTQWHQVAVTGFYEFGNSGNNWHFYQNAVSASDAQVFGFQFDTAPVIGRTINDSAFCNGKIDEFRVSKGIRSPDWVTIDYYQYPSSGFLSQSYASTGAGGRTTKNTRVSPLGIEIGMGWRMDL